MLAHANQQKYICFKKKHAKSILLQGAGKKSSADESTASGNGLFKGGETFGVGTGAEVDEEEACAADGQGSGIGSEGLACAADNQGSSTGPEDLSRSE